MIQNYQATHDAKKAAVQARNNLFVEGVQHVASNAAASVKENVSAGARQVKEVAAAGVLIGAAAVAIPTIAAVQGARGFSEGFKPVTGAQEGWAGAGAEKREAARERVASFFAKSDNVANFPSAGANGPGIWKSLSNAVSSFTSRLNANNGAHAEVSAFASDAHNTTVKFRDAERAATPGARARLDAQIDRFFADTGLQNPQGSNHDLHKAAKIIAAPIGAAVEAVNTVKNTVGDVKTSVDHVKDVVGLKVDHVGAQLGAVKDLGSDVLKAGTDSMKSGFKSFISTISHAKDGVVALSQSAVDFSDGVWAGLKGATAKAFAGATTAPVAAAVNRVKSSFGA